MAQQASGPNNGPYSGMNFDPVDWERRVAEARARREVALARRARAHGDPGSRWVEKEPPAAPWFRPPAPRAAIRAAAHAARLPNAAQAMSAASGAFSAASGVLELAMPRRRTRLAVFVGSGLAVGLVAAAGLFLGGDDPAPLPVPTEVATVAPAPEPASPAPDRSVAAITAPAPSRPEAVVEPLSLSRAEAPPAPELAPAEIPAVAAAIPRAPTPAGDARIFVHVPTGAPAATTDAVLTELASTGLSVAGLVPVRLEVGRSNVRYYHPEDAALAGRIAAALAVTPVGPTEARDLAEVANGPAPGIIEIWLAGDATPGPAPTMPMAPETAQAPEARPETRSGGIDPQVIRSLVEAARAGSD